MSTTITARPAAIISEQKSARAEAADGGDTRSFMQRLLVPARTLLGQREFVALLACNILVGLAYSFVGPFFSIFGTQEVRMSEWVFGSFMMASSAASIVVSTVLARSSDVRWSRRAMLLLGGSAGALGYGCYAFVRDPWLLALVGCTLMAVASITFSQLFAHARELIARSSIPSGETPLYMNVFRLFFALAWTVGPAVAAWVMVKFSFRGTFLVAATIFALFVGVVWKFVSAAPPLAGARARAELPWRDSFRRPGLLPHFIAFVLIFTCSTVGMQNLPLLVLNTLGGTGHDVGITYSVAPVFELPLMFYFGLRASRGDQAGLIRFAVGLAIAYYATLGLVQAPWQVYPLQVLSAAITAVTSGIAITFFQNFLPDYVGTATNLYSNAMRGGAMLGYLVFGTVAAAFGHRIVFFACAGLAAIALAILWKWRPRPGHPQVSTAQNPP